MDDDQIPIEMDDLAFDEDFKSYTACWKYGNIFSAARLKAVDDQPERGYRLTAWSCRLDGIPLSSKMQQRGMELANRLKHRFVQELHVAGWQPENDQVENIWRHKSQIEPVTREQPASRSKTLSHTKTEDRPTGSYQRTIQARYVTVTCSKCLQEVTRLVYPGATPQYCEPCAKEVEREKTRARVARLRMSRKV